MATDKEGWGAGKCPNCKSYNTDSNVGGAENGLASYDCLDCGHGWDQQPRKNARKQAADTGVFNDRRSEGRRSTNRKMAPEGIAKRDPYLKASGVGEGLKGY